MQIFPDKGQLCIQYWFVIFLTKDFGIYSILLLELLESILRWVKSNVTYLQNAYIVILTLFRHFVFENK